MYTDGDLLYEASPQSLVSGKEKALATTVYCHKLDPRSVNSDGRGNHLALFLV